MQPSYIMLIVIIAITAAIIIFTLVGKRMQKKQDKLQQDIDSQKQPLSIVVIGKKKCKMSESGLPRQAMESTPRRFKNRKVPIVRAKVGPKVYSMLCDNDIYTMIPESGECKVEATGLYIVGIVSIRGKAIPAPTKKRRFVNEKKLAEKEAKKKAEQEAAARQARYEAKQAAKAQKAERAAQKAQHESAAQNAASEPETQAKSKSQSGSNATSAKKSSGKKKSKSRGHSGQSGPDYKKN